MSLGRKFCSKAIVHEVKTELNLNNQQLIIAETHILDSQRAYFVIPHL